jgi:acyl carrier protein
MPPDAPPDATREASQEAVLREISRVLNSELQLQREVRPEDDLALDLQLDSVGLLTLVVELENTFRIALREEDSASVRTVGELAGLVAARAATLREPEGDSASGVPVP